jgi:cytochrome c oxidase subunit III
VIFVLLFVAIIAAIILWWLSRQRLFAKPWLEEGLAGEFPGAGPSQLPTAKIGLGVFLVVVGSLFALFLSAYVMRMEMADWRPLPAPTVLWLNTGLLILSSVALQWAQVNARRGDLEGVQTGLLAAGVLALAFLAGQVIAWRQLDAAGYYLASNPANTFFYALTALHGLHLLGGVVALGRTSARAWRGVAPAKLRVSVELCAIYWHFLLLIWLIVFALVLLGADASLANFIALCKSVITGTR